jgi:hypothetical protein
VPALPAAHPGDDGVALKICAFVELTAIDTDSVSGEMVDGCILNRRERCGMRIRTKVGTSA